jgi:hypothetical protein
MIHFAPNDKSSLWKMFKRVLCLLIFYCPLYIISNIIYAVYGGIPFSSIQEAFIYYLSVMWESLTSGNVIFVPIKLLFLPFIGAICSSGGRPGCEYTAFVFSMIYYTIWFYVLMPLAHKVFKIDY